MEHLVGAEGVTDLLLERVYAMYLPVFFWIKEVRRSIGSNRTAVIGMQCLQGGGKTTICESMALLSARDGLTCVVASIDGFYKTHVELGALARDNPNDKLLHGRGQPGTRTFTTSAVPEPLQVKQLTGRLVLVPRVEFPDEECHEHGGAGWEGYVVKEARGVVSIKFAGFADTCHWASEYILGWRPLN